MQNGASSTSLQVHATYCDTPAEVGCVSGRVDYDSLLDAEAVDGCKECSSYAGLGGPTEFWTRALTCGCDVCLAAFMDSSKNFDDYGFDMIYTKRGQSCKTTYHIPNHDEDVINNLIKNGHAYFRAFKLTYYN